MTWLDLDAWREILATLRGNKLRTALTAFGVFWGIFMLMLMLGSGNGLHNGVTADFADRATNTFFVWTQRTSKPWRGLPPGREFDLNNEDVLAVRREVREAAIVLPRNQLGGYQGGNNVARGSKAGAFNVMGDHPEIRVTESVRIVRGRFLNRLDVNERRKVAVIGTRVQEVLFEPAEDPLGQSIRINGVYFKVIGVFATGHTGEEAQEAVQVVFVPFSTFQHVFHLGDEVGWLAVTSQPTVPASVPLEKTLTLLRQRHGVAPDDLRALGSFDLEEEFSQIQGLFRGIRLLVWIVGSGTLAAGVIGVSNIMLIIVRERTREIGIRRALGATPLLVVSQVVLEAVLLTTLAGWLGLVFGLLGLGLMDWAARANEARMFVHPDVTASSAVWALVILVFAGAAAGLLPAARAVRIRPVTALRA